MPYDDPDATDPMTLHGVAVETDDLEAMREMAACFVEEFARDGFDADRIFKLFTTRGYAGPFLAYQTLGEEIIRGIIDEQTSLRGGRASSPPCVSEGDGRISLPILER